MTRSILATVAALGAVAAALMILALPGDGSRLLPSLLAIGGVAVLAAGLSRAWRRGRALEELADAAVRLACGEIDVVVPSAAPPLARLATALQATALQLRER